MRISFFDPEINLIGRMCLTYKYGNRSVTRGHKVILSKNKVKLYYIN